jgi:tetratricopeptide (TPR) repeat protein
MAANSSDEKATVAMKKRNILSLGLVGLVFVGLVVVAAIFPMRHQKVDTSAINTANNLYEAGHYGEASAVYEKLAAQGVRDSTLFYNLGNAYYRQGDLGRAILNYQRAYSLNPRDPDIRANLAAAREQVAGVMGVGAPTGPVAVLAGLTAPWLSLDQVALVALALWLAAGFLFLARRLQEKPRPEAITKYMLAFLLLLLALTSASLGSRIYMEKALPSGVVVAPEVTLSNGPGEQYVTETAFPAGTEITLLERQGAWARLAVSDDENQGWVPMRAVEMVSSIF